MVAKVGTDSLGESYLDNFRSHGVDTAHVGRTPEAATGVAQITVDDAGENVIIIVPGANGLLSAADVAAAGGAFDGARVLLTQLEVPVPTTVAALRAGRAAGLLTVFNSAPAPTAPLPPELFTLCDVVCPNETEAALMTGMPTETLAEAEAAARRIIEMGAKSVVMTSGGSRGCMLVSPDAPKPLHVEVPPELRGAKVVDTTGAGDGFLGALAHSWPRDARSPTRSPAPSTSPLSPCKSAGLGLTRRPRCCRSSSASRPPPRRRPPPRPPPPPSRHCSFTSDRRCCRAAATAKGRRRATPSTRRCDRGWWWGSARARRRGTRSSVWSNVWGRAS